MVYCTEPNVNQRKVGLQRRQERDIHQSQREERLRKKKQQQDIIVELNVLLASPKGPEDEARHVARLDC
jgi:hypothetical protein